jgi:hypothetical protein
MLLFAILSWLSLAALFLLLTRHYFLHLPTAAGDQTGNRSPSAYFRWLFTSVPGWFRGNLWQRFLLTYQEVAVKPYNTLEMWVHLALTVSFWYLVGSGFVFAACLFRGLTGVFLVFHMVLGGVFGLSLLLTVLFEAKSYPVAGFWPQPAGRNWEAIWFWSLVLSGTALVLTALLMMIPLWTLIGHLKTVWVHRLSAISALLSVGAFMYLKWYRIRVSHGR